MPDALYYVVIGGILGLSISFMFTCLDYWIYIHNPYSRCHGSSSICMVGGAISLSLAGIIAGTVNGFLTGSLHAIVLLGLGALTSYYAGFLLIIPLWLLKGRNL